MYKFLAEERQLSKCFNYDYQTIKTADKMLHFLLVNLGEFFVDFWILKMG